MKKRYLHCIKLCVIWINLKTLIVESVFKKKLAKKHKWHEHKNGDLSYRRLFMLCENQYRLKMVVECELRAIYKQYFITSKSFGIFLVSKQYLAYAHHHMLTCRTWNVTNNRIYNRNILKNNLSHFSLSLEYNKFGINTAHNYFIACHMRKLRRC